MIQVKSNINKENVVIRVLKQFGTTWQVSKFVSSKSTEPYQTAYTFTLTFTSWTRIEMVQLYFGKLSVLLFRCLVPYLALLHCDMSKLLHEVRTGGLSPQRNKS